MTPATSSQMSRSSSTTKISSAMIFSILSIPDAAGHRFGLSRTAALSPLPTLSGQWPEPVGMQGQRHARPLPRRIVRKVQLAIMLLDDLLDDRQAQAGAALARRHIGFGDRVARFGQPDTLVRAGNAYLAAVRKSGGWGKSVSVRVDHGGGRIIKKK